MGEIYIFYIYKLTKLNYYYIEYIHISKKVCPYFVMNPSDLCKLGKMDLGGGSKCTIYNPGKNDIQSSNMNSLKLLKRL